MGAEKQFQIVQSIRIICLQAHQFLQWMPTLMSGQLVSHNNDVKLVEVMLETKKTKRKRLLYQRSHFILTRWWQTDCCLESMRESMNNWTDEQNNGTGRNKIWPILISTGTISKTLMTLQLPLLLFSSKIPNPNPYTNASKAIHYHYCCYRQ